jgi:hypothetical protein
MAKTAKPEKLYGRQISKVAEQVEQEMGAKADPAALAERASALAKETFGVGHDYTADYFIQRREKAGKAKAAAAPAKPSPAPAKQASQSPAAGPQEGEVTLSELRALRTKLGEEGTEIATLAGLLPKIEEYVAIVGGLPRLREAIEFLNGQE